VAWAEAMLEQRGIRQDGPARQVRTWNLSSLWRIPLESGTAWLKCVPPFFAHEGAVLELLQDAPVPRLLAAEHGRILMPEIPGEDLYGAERGTLLSLLSILVDLQRRWIGREHELLGLGLPDWRAAALGDLVGAVVRRCGPDLSGRDRRTLDELMSTLPARLAAVRECGIPDTLVHGDFAPGNARGDGSTLVLLDWGDCGVGHPLLDQPTFLDRIRPEDVDEVRRHWARLWGDALPGADPVRAADLLAPLAAARQAVIYQGFLDRIEPSEHPYHRADPAWWLTRAAALT
jgi:hypothetical protein